MFLFIFPLFICLFNWLVGFVYSVNQGNKTNSLWQLLKDYYRCNCKHGQAETLTSELLIIHP